MATKTNRTDAHVREERRDLYIIRTLGPVTPPPVAPVDLSPLYACYHGWLDAAGKRLLLDRDITGLPISYERITHNFLSVLDPRQLARLRAIALLFDAFDDEELQKMGYLHLFRSVVDKAKEVNGAD